MIHVTKGPITINLDRYFSSPMDGSDPSSEHRVSESQILREFDDRFQYISLVGVKHSDRSKLDAPMIGVVFYAKSPIINRNHWPPSRSMIGSCRLSIGVKVEGRKGTPIGYCPTGITPN